MSSRGERTPRNSDSKTPVQSILVPHAPGSVRTVHSAPVRQYMADGDYDIGTYSERKHSDPEADKGAKRGSYPRVQSGPATIPEFNRGPSGDSSIFSRNQSAPTTVHGSGAATPSKKSGLSLEDLTEDSDQL